MRNKLRGANGVRPGSFKIIHRVRPKTALLCPGEFSPGSMAFNDLPDLSTLLHQIFYGGALQG